MTSKTLCYLRDLSLARKVVVFILLILLAFAFIVQQYQYSLSLVDEADRENERIHQIGGLIQQVETDVIASRLPEKEFLLRGDRSSVKEHDELLREVYANLDLLESQLKPEQKQMIKSIKDTLDGYIRNFSVLVSLKIRLGLSNAGGLVRKLRRSVTAVEAVVKGVDDPALLYRIEAMRGYERDYLIFKDDKFYQGLEREMVELQNVLRESPLNEQQKKKIAEKIKVYQKSFSKIQDGISKIDDVVETFRQSADAVAPVIKELRAQSQRMLADNAKALVEATDAVHQRFLIIIIAVALTVTLVLWFSARGIVRGVSRAVEIGSNVAQGDLSNVIVSNTNDEVGTLLKTLDRMQQQLKESIERDRRITVEALRIQTALDNVSTSVLVLDKDYRIIYRNQSAHDMLEHAEQSIQEEIPEFSTVALMDGTVDDLHCESVFSREMLDELKDTHRTRIILGGYTFDVTTNAVVNSDGERVGTAMEWDDVTDQVRVEQEIDSVVSSVSAGDFDQLISMKDKQGFFLSLGAGINELTNAVSDSIAEMEQVLGSLADGNLSHRIGGGKQGAFSRLAGCTNITISRLDEIVTEIREVAGHVAIMSNEISSGNENMSHRTEAQASSLEETASTMEEFTGTIKQNASSAQEANQLAENAKGLAEKGGVVVTEAIGAMQEITAASDKISNIIGVINDIAFQTNLLALNASVEAARAGEQGRGFAVVATEVRNLAGRSAQAAKEIKDLIHNSRAKVEFGTELVNQSGENLKEIVFAAQKVNDIVSEIAAASREQSVGVEQVNHAITDMDGVTQQNAALAEETSAVSHSLADQAAKLKQAVDFFSTVKDEKSKKNHELKAI
jgi:methyl-accepting chemotaxis protein